MKKLTKSFKIYQNLPTSNKNYQNLLKSIEADDIYQDQQDSMKTDKNKYKPTKITEYLMFAGGGNVCRWGECLPVGRLLYKAFINRNWA